MHLQLFFFPAECPEFFFLLCGTRCFVDAYLFFFSIPWQISMRLVDWNTVEHAHLFYGFFLLPSKHSFSFSSFFALFFSSLSPTPTPPGKYQEKMSGFLTDPETRKILRAAVPVAVGLASLAYLAVKLTSKPSSVFTSDKV